MMAHDRTEGDASAPLAPAMLQEVWLTSTPQERLERFHRLPWAEAETFFLSLSAHDQAEVVRGLPLAEQRLWMRLLAGLGHMTCYTFGKPYLPTLLAMKLD